MTHITKCPECHVELSDEVYWEFHQTMQDGHIWCVNIKGAKWAI